MKHSSIEKHPNKQLIIRDIASGMYSDEAIAQRYGLTNRNVVQRYRTRALPEIMRLMAYRDTDGLLAAINQNLVRVDKMLEGLEKWAVDPEDQNAYAMDPRANEISVIYTKLIMQEVKVKGKAGKDGREQQTVMLKPVRVRVKENLQDVIDRCFSETEQIGMRLETHKADQRVVLLKAMEVMGRNLQLLIDARDALSQKDSDESYRASLEELLRIIQNALRPYPEAMAALLDALSLAKGGEQPSAARVAGELEG